MLAQRLKLLRAEHGINQEDFAKAIGVTQGTVGNWETGKRNPDSKTLEKIADYFSVSIDYLLGHDFKIPEDAPEIRLLARHLAEIPEADRAALIENFKNTIDDYLKDKNI